MKMMRLASIGLVLVVGAGCAEGRDVLGPGSAESAVHDEAGERSARSARRIEASGEFAALVDFSTLTLTPRGRNCRLEVKGELVFSGTIEGSAVGQTSALVFAPCAEVATTPPGTYGDVFRSELRFEGTVNGEPARARVLYQGRVQPGGQIAGRLILSNGVQGRLRADAVVAVGGSYDGSLVVRR
jgi:hypothetical protein